MSNLSAKYDPIEASPHKSTIVVDEPSSAMMYIKAGMMPQNFMKLVGKSESFRDSFVGYMTANTEPDLSVLNVLATTLRTTEDSVTEEFRGLCEVTASIAYAWDKTELSKEAMLRIPPAFASRYLKSVYVALIERKMPSNSFRDLLVRTLPNAESSWNAEKSMFIQ